MNTTIFTLGLPLRRFGWEDKYFIPDRVYDGRVAWGTTVYADGDVMTEDYWFIGGSYIIAYDVIAKQEVEDWLYDKS